MTQTPLTLSRYKLTTFLACQRRFELRYQAKLAWPARPNAPDVALLQQRGEQFHQLLERHFLGLPITPNTINDDVLRAWWRAFAQSGLRREKFTNGRFYPELDLTVPIGDALLNGRFDLLHLSDQHATIFDWKTGKPQPPTRLRHDWQTRLYLAMLAESGTALGQVIPTDTIRITYWYVREPQAPRTITYSQSQHAQNWAELQQLADAISQQASSTEAWPLTDDWNECRHCAYQTYCGRQQPTSHEAAIDLEELEQPPEPPSLEPTLP